MDNIQYPITGSPGWGTKINNNFKNISNTIGNIDVDAKGDIGTQLENVNSQLNAIANTKCMKYSCSSDLSVLNNSWSTIFWNSKIFDTNELPARCVG